MVGEQLNAALLVYLKTDCFDCSFCQWLCPKSLLRLPVVADLNQQWLQIIKMLVDNIPAGLIGWISQFNQVVKPMLEQLRGLLNVTEEKAEL